jgi:hypothetical protein
LCNYLAALYADAVDEWIKPMIYALFFCTQMAGCVPASPPVLYDNIAACEQMRNFEQRHPGGAVQFVCMEKRPDWTPTD